MYPATEASRYADVFTDSNGKNLSGAAALTSADCVRPGVASVNLTSVVATDPRDGGHRPRMGREATGFELAKPFSNNKLCKKKVQEFEIGGSF